MQDYISPEAFQEIKKSFENEVCFIKAASSLPDILQPQRFESYLRNHEGDIHKYLMLYKNGKDIAIPAHSVLYASGQFNFVFEHFKNGATLKLEELEKRDEIIAHICQSLEKEFGGNSWSKAFWTPKSNKGVPIHFDSTSIIVVQLAGRKRWQIWSEFVRKPNLSMASPVSADQLGEPCLDVILEEGDVLYFPSGYPHCTESLDEHSLHIGLAINPTSVIELIEYHFRRLAKSNYDLRSSVHKNDRIDDVIARLSNCGINVSIDQLEQSFNLFNVSSRVNKTNFAHNSLASLSNQYKENAKFRYHEVRSVRVVKNDSTLKIYLPNQVIPEKPLIIGEPSYLALPTECFEVIEFMLSGQDFSVEELKNFVDEETSIALVELLIAHQIIVAN
ncbi:JmjC domain-containing protein [Gynuella sunshinyii]|uniref:JmjC domain-containing protein n=1 Tax=Gynuella sunshinyii YC6258 TaxID=1445510 RepID=A0A0C5VHR4_9GAMM|nr:cupin domain-containing protein [Gynuella sunshinyii]AJQ93776.1 hypothetical protein YC6258_01730 [Gynuella sunshinyii YC6258]